MLSCASKAPRALTGFLASTANRSQASGRIVKRNRSSCICQVHHWRRRSSNEASNFATPLKFMISTISHFTGNKWKFFYSPSSSSESYEISPDSLWEDLSRSISYLPSEELELVRKALNELDWESIAAGLLHDTVEDTNLVTFEGIEEDFGTTVRHIVEGETKVSKLGKFKSKDESYSIQDVKADDLRQMFLALTEEMVRVIIVKLADRLHNMRTLSHMPPHKQSSIAMETLQVFAPLAKLLGIYQIKFELENLAFMYTNPQDYAKVNRRLAEHYREHEKDLKEQTLY